MQNTRHKLQFRRLGTMLDCSRNSVMKPEEVCRWADETRAIGYNTLTLYLEDTYEIEGQPYFGYGRGRYSRDELKMIDRHCREIGMELIPYIETLGHLPCITRWRAFRPYIDVDDVLLIDDDRTYELIDAMLTTCAECFTSRVINIGMDEAYLMGRGKYHDQHGDRNRTELFMHHVQRVTALAEKHGFKTILLWPDMLFSLVSNGKYYVPDAPIDKSAREMIPENVFLHYADYHGLDQEHYEAMIDAHARVKPEVWFGGGLWTWYGLAPHNRWSIETTHPALAACRSRGVQDVVMTMWGDDGGECSRWSILPSLYDTAMRACGVTDEAEIKQGFEARYGISFDDFMLLDLPGTGNSYKTSNPDKYLLYNDPFLGLYDSTLTGTEAQDYKAVAEKLERVDGGKFQPLFDTLAALSRVLEIKADLGQRTRAAYSAGDKKALAAVAEDYGALLPRLEKLYAAVRAQWMAENKQQGFEVQDLRLGGVIRRVESCRQTLLDYLAGRLERIDPLEEPTLDLTCGTGKEHTPVGSYWKWQRMVTAGYTEMAPGYNER